MLVKLKDICQVVSGATPSTSVSSFYDGDIYWITPKDLADNVGSKYINNCYKKITENGYKSCSTVMIPKNNILISTRAPIGYIAINKMECCTNQGFKSLICDTTKVNTDYLYYLLKSRMKEIELLGSGTTFKEVSKTSIENFEIELPKLEVQKKIASILSSIDAQIEHNNAMVKRLQVLTQAIYTRWFLQFEFPNKEGKPYKSFGGKMVWCDELKREIPEGWEIIDLLNVVEWKTNSQPPKSEFKYKCENGYIRFIQNRDYDSDDHITYVPLKKSMIQVEELDILMDKYGDAGKVRNGIKGVFNVALAQIKPKLNNTREYLRSLLLSDSMYNYFHNSCMASTRASLSEENLTGVRILFPIKEILIAYETMLKALRIQMLKLNNQNKKLASLRDYLLPLLINGQLE